ncbi:TonB-dependent receptor plug domain-containing protein [Hyphococcus luteus]|uniref:TonB-dependent receptor n=1 Tax=Hyphococcus luteus TaxID=2058213 RepID=A0A2S7K4C3_9PROT|nr:TonB-dependent receptor [Marinicaulis flavus]PQA87288.1 TonB-dependent receptor [Marinicaulis flavus]
MFKKLSVIALALIVSAAAQAYAQAETQSGDTIIVTGTRAEGRTAFDSLAPVDVISDDALDLTASDEIMDSLAQLAPSFNVQRLPMNDGLIFVRPARLRNLSPDHTLVLVNGKRRHRSALLGSNGAQAPDLAQIPSFAVKRIEVLRDGASAQYGSDAIAGVINIILDDEPGLSAFGQYGQYYENDGDQYRAGVQGGLAGDYGFLNATFEFSDSARTSRTRQRQDAIDLQAANPDLDVPNPVQNWGQPERTSYRFAVNSAFDAGVTELYAFGTYGWGTGVSDFNWRNPTTTSAFNPSAAFPGFDLNDIYPTGFTPQFGQDDEDYSIAGGLRGNGDGPFSYDVSAGYGRNEIDYFIYDTINASLGPDSPTSFDPGNLVQREFNVNVDFGYEWDSGFFAEPVNIAWGGERREETYEIVAGDPASYAIGAGAADGLPSGSNGFPGYSEAQAGEFDQTSYAGYIDVEIPVTAFWTLGLAGRYEDFSEYGDSLDGKISTRFEITPSFALRATASTGFRAPTPGQLFSERTSQGLDTVTLNIFTAGRFSPLGPVAEVINARPDANIRSLDAEESENYTIGLAWSEGGFTATVDLYQINISDRFGTSQTFNPTPEEQAEFVALGVPGGEGITRVNFFQNDFDTRTRGVDVVASYAMQAGPGDLTLTGAYNYNSTKVTDGDLAANETTRVRFEEVLPNHTATASASYALGALELFARARYYGGWTDYSFNADGDIFQAFGGETFLDLAATYRFTDQLSIRAGAENVFDNYPDEAEFQANRGLIYSRNAPYDTDGGFYYVRLDVKL